MEKRFSIRISDTLYQRALAKARRSRTTLSQAIRWFLERWIQGEIEAVPPRREEETEE